MSGERAECLQRHAARDSVRDEPFAPLKPPDAGPCLGTEDPVDGPVMGSVQAERNLERRDVRRAGPRSRRQDEGGERARPYEQAASHPRSRRPLAAAGGQTMTPRGE